MEICNIFGYTFCGLEFDWIQVIVINSVGFSLISPSTYFVNNHNARRMRTSVTVLSLCVCVCVCVCPLSTRRLKVLYYNLNISAGFTLIFQGFQLTDFDKKPLFKRYSAFHDYFVVTRLYKRLRILLVV